MSDPAPSPSVDEAAEISTDPGPQPYDDLPLNTPTKVADDGVIELWATRTVNGGLVEHRPKPGTAASNRAVIDQALADSLGTLQQIIDTQPATVSNLASAQTAIRQLQTAVQAEALAMRRIIRKLLDQVDATT